jgi:UDP-N-acetylglucosamine--N-acetylmuramyl-(pentapeptide) pyrophosphoryl-undecaprenol N-acetylglucosamine transferase
MGGGGYVAGPAGLAAVSLRLPLVLTEADSHLGLANRLLAGRARRVCLAFPIPGRDGGNYLVTGRPVPAAVLAADRGTARERFGIEPGRRCLLVVGGSQGAHSINQAAVAAFAEPENRDFDVIQVAGRRDYPGLREQLPGGDGGYILLEYEPDLGDCLAASDLVLGRAGGSIFEFTAAGRPALLVPYPHATGDHQSWNAEWMAQAGAAVVIPDAELEPRRLRDAVRELLGDPDRLERMTAAARSLAKADAAKRIADEVLAAAASGNRGGD